MSSEPVKVAITVEAHPRTNTYEIDRAEWDAMTPEQRIARLDEMVMEEINDAGGGSWRIDYPGDQAATEG